MSAPTGRDAVQVMIRLPPWLRDTLKAAAVQNDRSLATEIYHRLKNEGPAETGISPDHGPTTPLKGTAMDAASNTTTPGEPAIPFDWEGAFERLENPINDAFRKGEVAHLIAGLAADLPVKDGFVRVPDDTVRTLTYMVFELFGTLKALEKQWVESHNAACRIADSYRQLARGIA